MVVGGEVVERVGVDARIRGRTRGVGRLVGDEGMIMSIVMMIMRERVGISMGIGVDRGRIQGHPPGLDHTVKSRKKIVVDPVQGRGLTRKTNPVNPRIEPVPIPARAQRKRAALDPARPLRATHQDIPHPFRIKSPKKNPRSQRNE